MAIVGPMCLRNIKIFTRFYGSKTYQNVFTPQLKSSLYHNFNSRHGSVAILCCNASKSRAGRVGLPLSAQTSPCQMSNCYTKCKPSVFSVISLNGYSTQKSSDTPGLTDQLLKAKIGEVESQNQKSNEKETEAKPDKKSGKTNENSWLHSKHAWKLGLISLAAMCLLMCGNVIVMWGAPIFDKDGNEIEDEFSILPAWQAYPKRAVKEARFFKTMIEEPSYKKLLPDPLKEPWYQPPYTLVIELTGVLVHPDWTLGTGWRFKKRPAVTYFLQQVASPMFEVVIFTKEQGFTAFPIIDGLDPNGHVTYRLFRDATHYMDGSHVKDLDNLNRDLSKVILVDCDTKAIQKQPRNALLLKPWKGQDDDRTLVDLAGFLRTIAMSQVDDIRPVIEHYSQFDNPLEAFKENQRRIQGEQERSSKVEQKESQGLMGFGRSFLRKR